jgi:hypothetical protein
MMRERDNSYTKIFGFDPKLLDYLGRVRFAACRFWCDGERTIPNRETYDNRPNPVAGLNDIPYWGTYFTDMFGNKNSNDVREVIWSLAERHGQSKWKEQIQKDFKGVL